MFSYVSDEKLSFSATVTLTDEVEFTISSAALASSRGGSGSPESSLRVKKGGSVRLRGVVKYVGNYRSRHSPLYGIEVESGTGDCDGTRNGTRFFRCAPNRGRFIKRSVIEHRKITVSSVPRITAGDTVKFSLDRRQLRGNVRYVGQPWTMDRKMRRALARVVTPGTTPTPDPVTTLGSATMTTGTGSSGGSTMLFFYGIELIDGDDLGDCDGTFFSGKFGGSGAKERLFKCKKNGGIFVKSTTKLVKCSHISSKQLRKADKKKSSETDSSARTRHGRGRSTTRSSSSMNNSQRQSSQSSSSMTSAAISSSSSMSSSKSRGRGASEPPSASEMILKHKRQLRRPKIEISVKDEESPSPARMAILTPVLSSRENSDQQQSSSKSKSTLSVDTSAAAAAATTAASSATAAGSSSSSLTLGTHSLSASGSDSGSEVSSSKRKRKRGRRGRGSELTPIGSPSQPDKPEFVDVSLRKRGKSSARRKRGNHGRDRSDDGTPEHLKIELRKISVPKRDVTTPVEVSAELSESFESLKSRKSKAHKKAQLSGSGLMKKRKSQKHLQPMERSPRTSSSVPPKHGRKKSLKKGQKKKKEMISPISSSSSSSKMKKKKPSLPLDMDSSPSSISLTSSAMKSSKRHHRRGMASDASKKSVSTVSTASLVSSSSSSDSGSLDEDEEDGGGGGAAAAAAADDAAAAADRDGVRRQAEQLPSLMTLKAMNSGRSGRQSNDNDSLISDLSVIPPIEVDDLTGSRSLSPSHRIPELNSGIVTHKPKHSKHTSRGRHRKKKRALPKMKARRSREDIEQDIDAATPDVGTISRLASLDLYALEEKKGFHDAAEALYDAKMLTKRPVLMNSMTEHSGSTMRLRADFSTMTDDSCREGGDYFGQGLIAIASPPVSAASPYKDFSMVLKRKSGLRRLESVIDERREAPPTRITAEDILHVGSDDDEDLGNDEDHAGSMYHRRMDPTLQMRSQSAGPYGRRKKESVLLSASVDDGPPMHMDDDEQWMRSMDSPRKKTESIIKTTPSMIRGSTLASSLAHSVSGDTTGGISGPKSREATPESSGGIIHLDSGMRGGTKTTAITTSTTDEVLLKDICPGFHVPVYLASNCCLMIEVPSWEFTLKQLRLSLDKFFIRMNGWRKHEWRVYFSKKLPFEKAKRVGGASVTIKVRESVKKQMVDSESILRSLRRKYGLRFFFAAINNNVDSSLDPSSSLLGGSSSVLSTSSHHSGGYLSVLRKAIDSRVSKTGSAMLKLWPCIQMIKSEKYLKAFARLSREEKLSVITMDKQQKLRKVMLGDESLRKSDGAGITSLFPTRMADDATVVAIAEEISLSTAETSGKGISTQDASFFKAMCLALETGVEDHYFYSSPADSTSDLTRAGETGGAGVIRSGSTSSLLSRSPRGLGDSKFDDTIELWFDCFTVDPLNPHVMFNLGQSLECIRKYQDAYQYYTTAIRRIDQICTLECSDEELIALQMLRSHIAMRMHYCKLTEAKDREWKRRQKQYEESLKSELLRVKHEFEKAVEKINQLSRHGGSPGPSGSRSRSGRRMRMGTGKKSPVKKMRNREEHSTKKKNDGSILHHTSQRQKVLDRARSEGLAQTSPSHPRITHEDSDEMMMPGVMVELTHDSSSSSDESSGYSDTDGEGYSTQGESEPGEFGGMARSSRRNRGDKHLSTHRPPTHTGSGGLGHVDLTNLEGRGEVETMIDDDADDDEMEGVLSDADRTPDTARRAHTDIELAKKLVQAEIDRQNANGSDTTTSDDASENTDYYDAAALPSISRTSSSMVPRSVRYRGRTASFASETGSTISAATVIYHPDEQPEEKESQPGRMRSILSPEDYGSPEFVDDSVDPSVGVVTVGVETSPNADELVVVGNIPTSSQMSEKRPSRIGIVVTSDTASEASSPTGSITSTQLSASPNRHTRQQSLGHHRPDLSKRSSASSHISIEFGGDMHLIGVDIESIGDSSTGGNYFERRGMQEESIRAFGVSKAGELSALMEPGSTRGSVDGVSDAESSITAPVAFGEYDDELLGKMPGSRVDSSTGTASVGRSSGGSLTPIPHGATHIRTNTPTPRRRVGSIRSGKGSSIDLEDYAGNLTPLKSSDDEREESAEPGIVIVGDELEDEEGMDDDEEEDDSVLGGRTVPFAREASSSQGGRSSRGSGRLIGAGLFEDYTQSLTMGLLAGPERVLQGPLFSGSGDDEEDEKASEVKPNKQMDAHRGSLKTLKKSQSFNNKRGSMLREQAQKMKKEHKRNKRKKKKGMAIDDDMDDDQDSDSDSDGENNSVTGGGADSSSSSLASSMMSGSFGSVDARDLLRRPSSTRSDTSDTSFTSDASIHSEFSDLSSVSSDISGAGFEADAEEPDALKVPPTPATGPGLGSLAPSLETTAIVEKPWFEPMMAYEDCVSVSERLLCARKMKSFSNGSEFTPLGFTPIDRSGSHTRRLSFPSTNGFLLAVPDCPEEEKSSTPTMSPSVTSPDSANTLGHHMVLPSDSSSLLPESEETESMTAESVCDLLMEKLELLNVKCDFILGKEVGSEEHLRIQNQLLLVAEILDNWHVLSEIKLPNDNLDSSSSKDDDSSSSKKKKKKKKKKGGDEEKSETVPITWLKRVWIACFEMLKNTVIFREFGSYECSPPMPKKKKKKDDGGGGKDDAEMAAAVNDDSGPELRDESFWLLLSMKYELIMELFTNCLNAQTRDFAKELLDKRFIDKSILLFNSPDIREHPLVRQMLRALYKKFSKLRPLIFTGLTNYCVQFRFDHSMHIIQATGDGRRIDASLAMSPVEKIPIAMRKCSVCLRTAVSDSALLSLSRRSSLSLDSSSAERCSQCGVQSFGHLSKPVTGWFDPSQAKSSSLDLTAAQSGSLNSSESNGSGSSMIEVLELFYTFVKSDSEMPKKSFLKKKHVSNQVWINVVLPMHKCTNIIEFSTPLSKLARIYLLKYETMWSLSAYLNCLFKYWPKQNFRKEQCFIGFVNELFSELNDTYYAHLQGDWLKTQSLKNLITKIISVCFDGSNTKLLKQAISFFSTKHIKRIVDSDKLYYWPLLYRAMIYHFDSKIFWEPSIDKYKDEIWKGMRGRDPKGFKHARQIVEDWNQARQEFEFKMSKENEEEKTEKEKTKQMRMEKTKKQSSFEKKVTSPSSAMFATLTIESLGAAGTSGVGAAASASSRRGRSDSRSSIFSMQSATDIAELKELRRRRWGSIYELVNAEGEKVNLMDSSSLMMERRDSAGSLNELLEDEYVTDDPTPPADRSVVDDDDDADGSPPLGMKKKSSVDTIPTAAVAAKSRGSRGGLLHSSLELVLPRGGTQGLRIITTQVSDTGGSGSASSSSPEDSDHMPDIHSSGTPIPDSGALSPHPEKRLRKRKKRGVTHKHRKLQAARQRSISEMEAEMTDDEGDKI